MPNRCFIPYSLASAACTFAPLSVERSSSSCPCLPVSPPAGLWGGSSGARDSKTTRFSLGPCTSPQPFSVRAETGCELNRFGGRGSVANCNPCITRKSVWVFVSRRWCNFAKGSGASLLSLSFTLSLRATRCTKQLRPHGGWPSG